jgi:hypothetical protein
MAAPEEQKPVRPILKVTSVQLLRVEVFDM